jgi:hypothetical protein
VVCVVWAINGGRLGKRARESSSQCLPRSLRASTTPDWSREQFTLCGLRQARTDRHASRWTFSRSSRLLCSYGPSIMALAATIFDSAAAGRDERDACRLVADGSHALGCGSECDGLAAKHRHTHLSAVDELALKAEQSCSTREAAT